MPDREKVIERLTGLKELLKFQKDILGYGSFIEDINDVLALLKEQEAEIDEISDEYIDLGKEIAKLPKIVRCKDCKWGEWLRNMRGDGRYRCKNDNTGIECGCTKEPDFFCAYGEKR